MTSLADRVNPGRCLLLVVDIQNDFCHRDGSMSKAGQGLSMVDEMIPRLLRFVPQARQNGVPVAFTRIVHSRWTDSPAWITRHEGLGLERPQHCREGSWGAELFKVSPQDNERVFVKHRYSAFYGTDLDVVLRSTGVQTLLLAGVVTNLCVETTARDGLTRDYNIVFLSDCTAAYSAEEHEATLNNMARYFGIVTTSEEVLSTWQGTWTRNT